ncbi:MAG TPA: hypothetical protein VMV46_20635 [Thermoanaerobaculia bacterium]|nr:hypothetical protein [Thermoanaerobaculia bacterium]
MLFPRQPAPLAAPAASRPASAAEIDALRRFHLGTAPAEGGSPAGEVPTGLWSWVYGASATVGPPHRDEAAAAVLPLDVTTPLRSLWSLLAPRRIAARRAWLSEGQRLARGLRALLQREPGASAEYGADHGAEHGAERLRHGLGALGDRFVDTAALSSSLGDGPSRMSPERRRRIERALERLEAAGANAEGDGVLVCEGALAHRFGVGALAAALEGPDAPPRLELDDDPCGHLAHLFDREAEAVAADIAAVRVARLELDDSYRPELHDAALGTFDWQAFHRDELPLLPPLVAVLGADSMAGPSLGPLFRLLLSARPVQVVVLLDPAASPGAGVGMASSAYRFEPGLLALGLRCALVHQGSIARPEELARAFERAAEAPCAALHVLATPALAGRGREQHAEDAAALDRVAVASRAHPLFLFDPTVEADDPERLRLDDAIDTGADGASLALEVGATDGAAAPTTACCTFADYALASGCFARDLLAIDDQLAHDHLVPIDAWLERPQSETRGLVPFVWAVIAPGGAPNDVALRRLAVSRRLALCARDRLDTWRTLQRLAGIHHPQLDAVRAAEREAAHQRATEETARLGAEHARELEEQRKAVAGEVVTRLVAALLGDGATAPARAGAADASPDPDA